MKKKILKSICVLAICLLCVGLFPLNSSAKTYTHTFYYDLAGGATFFYQSPIYKVKDNATFRIGGQTPFRDYYRFEGYHAYRMVDHKYYISGKGWQSYETGAKLYQPDQQYTLDSSWTRGCRNSNYTFKAVWTHVHYIDFLNSRGSIYDPAWRQEVTNGEYIYISHRLKKNGKTCSGWNVKRVDNNGSKWYVSGQGWVDQSTINRRGWTKKLYKYGEAYTFDNSWLTNCSGWAHYEFAPVY